MISREVNSIANTNKAINYLSITLDEIKVDNFEGPSLFTKVVKNHNVREYALLQSGNNIDKNTR